MRHAIFAVITAFAYFAAYFTYTVVLNSQTVGYLITRLQVDELAAMAMTALFGLVLFMLIATAWYTLARRIYGRDF